MVSILYSPSEPWEIKNDFGNVGISTPSIPCDYVWYCNGRKTQIERKHVPQDLLASINDGRLTKVTQILIQNIEKGGRSYLLLEGFIRCNSSGFILNPDRPSGWEIDKVSSLISSIQASGIELLLSPSIKETALILISQMRWEMKGEHKSTRTRPGPTHEWGQPAFAPYMLWSIQGIPGVGADLAEILYGTAPTWEKLLELSIEDLQQLKRIGKKRAEGIWTFLHTGKLL